MQVIIFFIVKSNAVNLLICHEYEKYIYIYFGVKYDLHISM